MSEADRRSYMMPDIGTMERVWEREVVFEWKIKNFSKIPDGVSCSFYSPDFDYCGRTWYLQLYPNGEEERSEGYIELYLFSLHSDLPLEVRISLSIRAGKGEKEMEETCNATFQGVDPWFCVSEKTIERSEIFRRRKELLPLDILTVIVALKAKLPLEGTKDVSVQTGGEDITAEDVKDEPMEKTGTERVLQDIGNLWPGGDHCDVVLMVRDVEFQAHRAILAARTPVLAAMFRHDTAEKASGEVTIEDCEPAVFEQFLYYIYNGAPRQLTAENACSLYAVADKYLVSEVKALCVRCMRDTLCVDTFCSTAGLSLMHREDELLEAAVDFFTRNMLRILETVQWQIFLRDHSTWANEILICSTKIGATNEERRADGGSPRS